MESTMLSVILKLTLAGSVLALAVLLLRLAFGRRLPRTFTVWLWIAVFIAFVVPVSIPAPAFASGLYGGINVHAVQTEPQQDNAVTVQQTSQPKAAAAQKTVPYKRAAAAVNAEKPVSPYRIALIIWGGVFAVLLTALIALYALTSNRLKALRPVPDDEDLRALRSAVRVRRAVPMGCSANTAVPVTAGIIRARIVFPVGFNFSDRQAAEHIYAHELIHIKRNDNLLGLAALFVACLHWFNPLVWIAYRMLCRDIELSCDSRVIKIIGFKKRAEYANSLLMIAGEKRKIQPVFATAFGKYDIKERVTNVMDTRGTRRISAGVIGLCITCALIAGVSFAAASCTKTDKASSAGGASSQLPQPSAQSSSQALSKTSSASSTGTASSSAGGVQKDIMNKDNEKKFKGYITDYYETFLFDWKSGKELTLSQNYQGSITESNGSGLISYAILNNQSGIDLDKYKHDGNATTQWYYELPQNLGDEVIKSCFDIKSADHSAIGLYDAKKKAYIVSGSAFYNALDGVPVISGIKQTGDTVVATADIYQIAASSTDEAKPDMSKKLQSMRFTFKSVNGAYLYEKVETI